MSLSDDLRALREGAAIGVVTPTRQIAVTGTDRAAFLHGLLTNDIKSLTAGSGCYAAWLTPQGRMQTDMHVFELGDMLLLDVPADQAGPTLERLDGCIFAEDVRVESLDGAFAALWIHGPAAATTLESALGAPGVLKNLGAYRALRVPFDRTEALIVRVDQLGVPGLGMYVRPAKSQTLRDALRNAGAVDVAPEAIEAARIEAGYPRFGMDMTADTIPLEAGIEGRAISFTKGCYVGQEVIVRVLHRGQGRVAKRLVGLRFEAPATAARTARLLSNGREIGFVTSAAQSPAGGSTGMGYVHRDFVEAGTVLQAHGEGGDAARATVTGLAGHPVPAPSPS